MGLVPLLGILCGSCATVINYKIWGCTLLANGGYDVIQLGVFLVYIVGVVAAEYKYVQYPVIVVRTSRRSDQ